MNASTRITRTITTRQGRTVESDLTNLEAIEQVGKLDSQFARDLYAKRERLSDEQLAWCHVLAIESRQPRPEPPQLDFAGISALFDKAAQHLKQPKIELVTSDGVQVALVRCGAKSRCPGSISVVNGAKRKWTPRRWYGRIHRDGSSELVHSVPASVVALLVEFSANPAEVAARCGKLLGRCCFCGAGLKDERSTSVGYGPICAKRYGLPWGEKGAGHEHEHDGGQGESGQGESGQQSGAHGSDVPAGVQQGASQAPQAAPPVAGAEATLEPAVAEQELLQDANALLEAIAVAINQSLGVQVEYEPLPMAPPESRSEPETGRTLLAAARFTFQKQLF